MAGIKNLISTLLFLTTVLFLVPQVLSAGETRVTPTPTQKPASNCQPIYGGGQTCKPADKLTIDKKVIHPTSKAAVDNIGINDPKFRPGQEIRFSIAVRNTGTTDLTNIELVDTMADFVEVTSGSVEFEEENNEFFFMIDRIKPGETKVYELYTRVIANEYLPSDKGIVCVSNRAAVAVNDQLAEDTTQFCIQKDILGVTPQPQKNGSVNPTPLPGKGGYPGTQPGKGGDITIPPTSKGGQPVYPAPETKNVPQTGPEALALIGLLPSAATGLFLRNRTK